MAALLLMDTRGSMLVLTWTVILLNVFATFGASGTRVGQFAALLRQRWPAEFRWANVFHDGRRLYSTTRAASLVQID